MRALRRNQKKMKYSLLLGEAPIYVTDEDGNVKYESAIYDGVEYTYPIETGETEIYYSTPVDFKANIALSGGDSDSTEYGLSTADYEAIIMTSKGAVPIVEGSLIWVTSEVESLYTEEVDIEIDGQTYRSNAPKRISADYTVIKCSPSLNEDKYILKAVNK